MSQTTPVVSPAAAGTPAPPRSGARVPELDGLRGIAILLVLLFHFTPLTGPVALATHVLQTGWIGVDLFFVLSGYLITGILLDSAERPHYYRNFFVRRSLRIFPLYYACLVLYLWVTFAPAPIRWHDFLFPFDGIWYLPYLGNFRVFARNAWPPAAILTPLWSLQVEEQFYWSYPFVVALCRRNRLAILLAASIGIAFTLRVGLWAATPANYLGAYVLMPCRMDSLAMGGLVAVAAREKPRWLEGRWPAWLALAGALVFALVAVLFGEAPISAAMRTVGYTAADAAFTGLLIILIARRPPALLWICRRNWLVWLGTISYGLYLLHVPALVVADRWIVPALHLAPRGSTEFFLCFPLAIIPAWVSWIAFESPVLRLKRFFAR
ncbi:MAG: acyltransferase [Acidobacteriia bacterium]|nr:acyltransferase [Terriglobia bacterium]